MINTEELKEKLATVERQTQERQSFFAKWSEKDQRFYYGKEAAATRDHEQDVKLLKDSGVADD